MSVRPNVGAWPDALAIRNRSTATPVIDTASAHKVLRDAINDFQDKWRGRWESSEIKRHHAMNLDELRGYHVTFDGTVLGPFLTGDRERNNLTPELRRYLQILCYVGTPTDKEVEEAKYIAASGNKAIIRSDAGAASIKKTQEHAQMTKDQADAIVAAATASGGGASLPTTQDRGKTIAPPGSDPRSPAANVVPTKNSVRGVSWATTRQIVPRPNTGSICPSWLPPTENIPLDEGEAIDLALPVKERAPLRAQREKLLNILDAAQKANPNDTWIAGQRLRFAVDQRDTTRALAVANDCRGDEAFCLSVKGVVLQQSEKFLDAEKTFRQAETVDPARNSKEMSCGLADALMLLNHDDVDVFRSKSCSEQHTMMDRVWWLADPLWSVPGNERYIAHNVRTLQASLHAVTDRDERYIWAANGGGQAMRELVVRYGWPSYTYWAGRQVDEEMNKYREFGYEKNQYRVPPYTAKEYLNDRTALLPSGNAVLDPFQLKDDAWQLYSPTPDTDSWWPQEHFYYPTRIGTLNAGQDILWRRDTSDTYQLVIDNPLQKLDPSSTAASKAMLMGGDGPTTTRVLAQSATGKGFTLRLVAELPSTPIVMSAEVLPRTLREQALRRRYAVRPPPTLREMKNGEVAISQPLLLRMPNRTMLVPVDEPTVLRYMAGDLTFAPDEPIALYWESYGFAAGDTVDVELKFRHEDELNAAQRALGAVGVGGARDSVSIKWREPDPRHASVVLTGAKPVMGRSVAVDLSALQGGSYVVSIEMRRGGLSARSERRILVKKRAE
ncbi:MAG: hypothetical protein ABJB74_04865 [Gemmatimonas sp.]